MLQPSMPFSLNRDAAWQLLNEYTKSESLLKHAMAVEAAVRGYAKKFGEDEEGVGPRGAAPRLRLRAVAESRGPSISRLRDSSRPGLPRMGDPRDSLARRLQ